MCTCRLRLLTGRNRLVMLMFAFRFAMLVHLSLRSVRDHCFGVDLGSGSRARPAPQDPIALHGEMDAVRRPQAAVANLLIGDAYIGDSTGELALECRVELDDIGVPGLQHARR